jgi:uncharacterized protein (TIGR03083 family)
VNQEQHYGGCEPILCAHLLRKVDGELIRLLGSLRADEWDAQTIAPRWKVRDVAAHLLDTVLRKLSLVRDSWWVENASLRTPEDVIEFVNRLNHEGVAVYRRLSPAVLIEMMTMACEESAAFHESLDPFGLAAFNVSWAGEEKSLNWFDTARELTERWHHQQQIRLATNLPGIMTRELYYPVLDCFLRGLPHAYRTVAATVGTSVLIEVSGECGGNWVLTRETAGWRFVCELPDTIVCKVTMPQETAWRVFTKGIDRKDARAQSTVEGNAELAEGIFWLTAIVG